MILHRYIVSALGHLVDSGQRDSSRIPRSAVENAGRLLDANGNKFQARIPIKGLGHIQLDWRSDDYSCAMASFIAGEEMLSTDAILSGLRPDADRKVLESAQAMVRELCQSAGEKAADGIYRTDKRPAVACIRWSTQEREGMDLVEDLELCLAAAFLERGFRASSLVV